MVGGVGWDGGAVRTLERLHLGDGPRVYAGGSGVSVLDGGFWTELGDLGGGVLAIEVFDDGTGPSLYAGRSVPSGGGKVWRFDGAEWRPLDAAAAGIVHDLTVFDDGSGPALYAAGDFGSIGGVDARDIARWDGVRWSALDGGLGSFDGQAEVRALQVFDDGTGAALYATGSFREAGSAATNHVAKWDGDTWLPVGEGLPSLSKDLVVFDYGEGPALYAAPFDGLYRWDGTAWGDLGPNEILGDASAVEVHDDGRGPALFFVGYLWFVSPSSGNLTGTGGPLRWDGATWENWRQLSPVSELGRAAASSGDSLFIASNHTTSSCLDGPDDFHFGMFRYDCSAGWCARDMNCDGVIDAADIARLTDHIAQGWRDGDVNLDNAINFFDLADYIGFFDTPCP